MADKRAILEKLQTLNFPEGLLSGPDLQTRKVLDDKAWSRNLAFKVELKQLENGTMGRLVKARRRRQQLQRREVIWHS